MLLMIVCRVGIFEHLVPNGYYYLGGDVEPLGGKTLFPEVCTGEALAVCSFDTLPIFSSLLPVWS